VAKSSATLSALLAAGVSKERLCELARNSGFRKRAGGKIEPADFLAYFCDQAAQGTVSYNDLAAAVEKGANVSASRQAYWERMSCSCLAFFQAVLACVLAVRVRATLLAGLPFKRILIQDSTVIPLPAQLFAWFSGVKNGTAAVVCNARIQAIYDLLAGCFIHFSIDAYSRNDLVAAPDIAVEPGDLVLRDRGYFVLDVIAAHSALGANTISRYKHKTALYDPETGQALELLALLQERGALDRIVLAGEQKKLRLRLIAVPVPEEVANLRRMKAKKETKGHNPSAELLALMSWSIFITTVEDPRLTPQFIMQLYGLRWRIENIFKTWKSNFSFEQVHQVSALQLRVLLTARLILLTIAYQGAFFPLCTAIWQHAGKQLSLMKLMRYLSKHPDLLPSMLAYTRWSKRLLNALARFCTYERRARRNFAQRAEALLSGLAGITFP
jgi:hypothetical protein